MAERVVDLLEAVEVDEHHRHWPVLPARPRQHVLHLPGEHGAVQQPGQRIVVGEVEHPLLGTLLGGDVARHASVAGEAAGRVVDRLAADRYVLVLAGGQRPAVDDVAEGLVPLQYLAVRAPVEAHRLDALDFPAPDSREFGLPHCELASMGNHRHEPELGVLLPEPVGAQPRKRAKARLARGERAGALGDPRLEQVALAGEIDVERLHLPRDHLLGALAHPAVVLGLLLGAADEIQQTGPARFIRHGVGAERQPLQLRHERGMHLLRHLQPPLRSSGAAAGLAGRIGARVFEVCAFFMPIRIPRQAEPQGQRAWRIGGRRPTDGSAHGPCRSRGSTRAPSKGPRRGRPRPRRHARGLPAGSAWARGSPRASARGCRRSAARTPAAAAIQSRCGRSDALRPGRPSPRRRCSRRGGR